MRTKDIILAFCLFIMAAVATAQNSVAIPGTAGVQKISLDGNWQFTVA